MSINLNKMFMVPFSRKKEIGKLDSFAINGVTIPFVSESKYLGITVNKMLD